jgi:hypothetical protein
MDESGIVKCPECGGEMEKGYLVSEAIKWSTQGHPQWALEQETIVHGYAWTFTNTEAFRCPACRLALFRYERKKEVPLSFLKKCVECVREIPLASEECSYCGARQKGGMKT